MDEKELIELKDRISKMINPKRYAHCLRVAEESRRLAKAWGMDEEKAYLTGLVHDVARDMPEQEYLRIAKIASIPLYEEADNINILHAPIGAYILSTEFGIDDPEILDAVAKHTVSAPGMSDFAKIIFLADMIEPERSWEGLDYIRELAYSDLDKAMYVSLGLIFYYLRQKGKYIVSIAQDAYDYFRCIVEEKEANNSRNT